jgi:hypothetical protein
MHIVPAAEEGRIVPHKIKLLKITTIIQIV